MMSQVNQIVRLVPVYLLFSEDGVKVDQSRGLTWAIVVLLLKDINLAWWCILFLGDGERRRSKKKKRTKDSKAKKYRGRECDYSEERKRRRKHKHKSSRDS